MNSIAEISRSNALTIGQSRWLIAPVPKVASTLLKRLGVIADGREPLVRAEVGETRPALAIHRADVHGLPAFADLPYELQEQWLHDAHALRLAVTRHPGERLLSFWHDKLHLADPAYAPLNASIQAARGRDSAEACRFPDFIVFLGDHWEQLQSDGHLRPQRQWLGDGSLFNRRLDRDRLVKDLPSLLEPLVDAARLDRLRNELQNYDKQFRQRLGKRWEESYGKDGLAILERCYSEDFAAYDYTLPRRRKDHVRPLASVDQAAIVDPLIQLRDRHQQIAGLEQEIKQLQQQLREAQLAIERPPLPSLAPKAADWPAHNSQEAGLGDFYDCVQQGRCLEVLEQTSSLQSSAHAGEIAYLQGLAHASLDHQELAIECFKRAQSEGFLTPYVLFNEGNAYRALGNTSEGIHLYREAINQFPDFNECRHNLSLGLVESGDSKEAERELRLLLRDQPSYHQASFCLGNLLRDDKRSKEAIEAFNLCLQFAPAYAEAWNNLGLAYGSLTKTEDAVVCYRQALTINASFKPARQNLAQAFAQLKRHADALEQFEIFSKLDLSEMEKVTCLQGQITCLMELDRYQDGLDLADAQSGRRIQLMARLHVLPVLYQKDSQVDDVRKRWTSDAEDLYQLLDGIAIDDQDWQALYCHAWSVTNFYLAYQMEDDRPQQELYAGILDRILRPRLGSFMQPLPQRHPDDSTPIRVGVISPHLRNHNGSIWAIGWLEGIARDPAYKIFSYNIVDSEDSGTKRFISLGTYRYLPLRGENPEPMLQQIIDDKLDLLIFTDIGMHAASKITSVLQLAPVQVQGWGHPISSGSSTMHYYFSGAGMEPDGNEAHYSETLYRLPKTGLNYETPVALHDGKLLYEKFDLPTNRPILNSLQSTFKYLPRNDWTFAEIAFRHPEVLILFVGHMGNGGLGEQLLQRMRPHFEQRDLVLEEHLRILPRLEFGDYMGVLAISHHTIDTIDWNGGNSSMQSLSLDCPVVTLPTAFMRGRHTVSMLEVLELQELIAKNHDDYINISVRLLKDEAFYRDMKSKISERKKRLFHDKSIADAFRKAVDDISRRSPDCGQQPSHILSADAP